MKKKKTNYCGKIFSGKNYISEGVLILKYRTLVPSSFEIYFTKDDNVLIDPFKNDITSTKPFIIECDYDRLYMFVKNTNHSYSLGNSSTTRFKGDIETILIIHKFPNHESVKTSI